MKSEKVHNLKRNLYQNDQNVKNALNSGRSINKKRGSHDKSYLTENINKSAVLSLTNYPQNTICHKVIPNNTKKWDKSKKVPVNSLPVNSQNRQNKLEIITHKRKKQSIPDRDSINKQKSDSLNRIHSHRQTNLINLKNRDEASARQSQNCSNKQNVCSNILQKNMVQQKGKSYQKKFNICSLLNGRNLEQSNLNFIIQKTEHKRNNLVKKKLILTQNNSIFNKMPGQNDPKDMRCIVAQQDSRRQGRIIDTSRSVSNSIKNCKNSSKNSSYLKNSTNNSDLFAKSYVKMNDSLGSFRNINKAPNYGVQPHEKSVSKLKNLNMNSKPKSCLKIKSSHLNHCALYPTHHNDKQTEQNIQIKNSLCHQQATVYSIKQILQMLIGSENSKQRKIEQIIKSLTTENNSVTQNDLNITHEKQYNAKIALSKQSQQTQTSGQCLVDTFMHKINDFEQNQTHQKPSMHANKPQAHSQRASLQSGLKADLKADLQTGLLTEQIRQSDQTQKVEVYSLQVSRQKQIIRKYEIKIIDLYQELIKQKQKSYKLQQIIEKYIKIKQEASKMANISKLKQQNENNQKHDIIYTNRKTDFTFKSFR